MQVVEKGEFFPINTENRQEAFEIVAKQLKAGNKDKGSLVRKLEEEEAYSQKQDCKDFIKNLHRCRNIAVESISERKIAFPERTEKVKN